MPVYENLLQSYQTLKKKYDNLVGALVEARLEALLNRFDNREVPGRLFHTEGKVRLPRFVYVSDTYVKSPGGRSYRFTELREESTYKGAGMKDMTAGLGLSKSNIGRRKSPPQSSRSL